MRRETARALLLSLSAIALVDQALGQSESGLVGRIRNAAKESQPDALRGVARESLPLVETVDALAAERTLVG